MILKTYIPKIKNQNVQNEYYLTDIFDVINRHEDLEYHVYQIPEEQKYQMMGVNTPEELQNVEKRLRK
jgi:bifunctional N-acetylglucosamine-1-phosphate-uridyltransferase/glucosamine-1-phosphate-acetyltransferase GlmU-like protein